MSKNIRWAANAPGAPVQNVHVDRGGANVLVTQQFLHGADIVAVGQQVRGKRMAKGVYLTVVLDAWSRRIAGWSMANHLRTELVLDALIMALWRRTAGGASATALTARAVRELLRDARVRAPGPA